MFDRRQTAKFRFRRLPAVGLLASLFALLYLTCTAAAASTRPTFDHFSTGFELVGQHRDVPCDACHVSGVFKGTPRDCASCHIPGARVAASAKPTNHILSGNDCSQCHTPAAWKPAAMFDHLNVIGTCASCHNGVQTVGKPAQHIPTGQDCGACHLVTSPWSVSTFAHVGITGDCASCHDNKHAPGKPATHLPTAEACETCHSRTNFKTFSGTAMNHAGIVQNCQSCHETGMSWYGVTMVDRPTAAKDSFHPAASSPGAADCASCHTGFAVGDFSKLVRPANHIPFAAGAACGACHTLTDFAAWPSLSAIHRSAPSTTSNCGQCHGAAAASFAIPAANNFKIVGMPAGHIPTQESCESCHVGAGSSIPATPVADGATFKHSAMSHAGITTGCATCHGPAVTGASFVGITKIVVMPATSPMGVGAHAPTGTTCETCHVASAPSGLVPANASLSPPGTKFASPVPTTAQIHTGITSGCTNCHEGGYAWMGMDRYPLSPSTLSSNTNTQYTGFDTRPGAGGAFGIADPAHPTGGDCVTCHKSTAYFSGSIKPSNHIPTSPSASCTNCHTTTNFATIPTVANIHLYAPTTSGGCDACHGAAAPTFAIPSANFSIVGLPSNHIPTGSTPSCDTCHVGPGSSIAATPVPNGATFKNSAMSHAGITTGCATCHGPTITGSTFYGISKIVVMPPTSPMGVNSHVPSGTTCETCHVAATPSGLVPGNASLTPPGTRFATPAPTTAQIHTGITSGCTNCHEAGFVWMGGGSYPIAPAALSGSVSTQYTGFDTRPGVASTFGIADPAHPASGDCVTCHTSTNYFSGNIKPSNHIPTSPSATCANCHTTANFATIPTLANIHLYAPTTSGNCDTCHGPAAPTFAIPSANFSIVGLPSNHVPTGSTPSCDTCHVGPGSSIAATPVPNGATFKNSAMSHVSITSGCATCHGPTITGSTFYGISKIVVMPATSPVGVNSHVPSGTTCETCHVASTPSSLVPGNASLTPPGTKFATPAPTTAQIHTGITSGCTNCHEAGYLWMGMSSYPIVPSVISSNLNTQYTGFDTRPGAGSTYGIADTAHPAGGDCVVCHTSTAYFSGNIKPSNHIPTSTTATCANCHTTTNFATIPTLANIHLYAPTTSGGCDTCHGAAAPTFAIPSANFSIVGLPSNHVPTGSTPSCDTCHVGPGSSIPATPVPNGATFKNSAMSHVSITSGCATCHGPTITGSTFYGISKIVVMPATSPVGINSHVPSGTTCETCHVASTPSGLVPGNASLTPPGTKFATPAPTTAQIHTGITSGCTNCHEAGFLWMGMSSYPIVPSVISSNLNTQYTGFDTRPGTGSTYGIADTAHPVGGDCVVCHTSTVYFSGNIKPSNHIPTSSTATCANCHTTSNFATIPTLANIHLYAPTTSGSCDTCHGPSAPSFAIPSANFSIVGLPSNHVPTGSTPSCDTCHVGPGSSIAATPVPNGATFKNSAMNHVGITSGCVTCHGPTITGSTFYGISKIVVMPATSPVGINSHVPSGTTCETCHVASTPSGLVPGNASLTPPGTKFATPAPTTAQIHTGITSGCTNCHEAGYLWMGMTSYPIVPSVISSNLNTQYTGFDTRPGTGSTYGIADTAHPVGGDCVVCHTSTVYFSGNIKPSNHIPTSTTATCANCHTTSNFATNPTLANIHLYAPTTSGNCDTCHGPAAPTFAIPSANFSIVGLPSNHVPTGSTPSCDTCHVGPGSSIAATPVPNGATFKNSAMSHVSITSGCATCHGPTITGSTFYGISKIVVMPATSPVGINSHVPSGTTCETCHVASTPSGLVPGNASLTPPGTKFATPAPTTAQIHTGITSGCTNCHEAGYLWMGMSSYPIVPSVISSNLNTQYTGFDTRPGTGSTYGIADAAHPVGGDCVVCHTSTNYFSGNIKPANHIPTSTTATCANCHTTTNFAAIPTLANIHLYAPTTSGGCDTCHGPSAPSFAIPSANFSIVGLPSNHVPTGSTPSCDTCHVGPGSSIAATPVPNGATFKNSAMNHVSITSGCATCHGPTITGSTFYGISKIVVMPATSPVGIGSHIPSGTTCETCHVASTPSGLVPGNASLTPPGTKFATPAPTTAQIHTGITSGCTNCHEAGYLWMDMSSYPIVPSVISSNLNTQYTGFDTRPGTGSTYGIADTAHPTTGDCVVCHTSTTYFSGNIKPANHIPTSATATCGNCHTTTNYATIPTLANIHLYAPTTSGGCDTCHGPSAPSFAIPSANFSIVGLPSNHIPTGSTPSCDTCHVGPGSSIAATPVPNGATFKNSAMNHVGITSGCVTCHGPTITGSTFYGISKIVVMPATSPVGIGSHIPSGTTCETCHVASTPSGLVPGNASLTPPGTKFATPAPTTAQIHTGISAGCANCHEAGYVWMGMTNYPIVPAVLSSNTSTQYTGFDTRPGTTATTYGIADAAHPTTGDCSNCHTGTTFFAGNILPSNHIPLTSNNCATCHTTAGTYATITTNYTQLHTAVSTSCHTCHADGAGPFAAAPGFVIVQMSTKGTHIPITNAGVAVECSGCHKLVTTFSGTTMSHSAIGDVGTSATGNACDSCHEYGMSNQWYGLHTWQRDSKNHYYCSPGGTTICKGGGADCTTGCHQHSIPNSYKAQPRRPAVVTPASSGAGQHPSTQSGPAAASPVVPMTPRTAMPGGWDRGFGAPDHSSLTASCVSCHNGMSAVGKPAAHVMAGNDCDRCHTSSGWKPAAFDHQGVLSGTCLSCHNGVHAQGIPAGHPAATVSCDSCHYVLAWTPTRAPKKASAPRAAPRTPLSPRAPAPLPRFQ